MANINSNDINAFEYGAWKDSIISEIRQRQYKAILNVNMSTLENYFKIGCRILQVQHEKGWGAHVIDMLSVDLEKEFGVKNGYSARNLRNMKLFAKEYPDFPIWQVPLAKLGEEAQLSLSQITWYHHISLISKVKDLRERAFYMSQTAINGWSRDVMMLQISNGLYHSKASSVNNFKQTLPPVQSDLAEATFKDPYNFGFLEMRKYKDEVDVEMQLIKQINDFLLEMGKGFAYVGRQYHLVVDGDDHYIDLLMYHTRLHCYVVVELKVVDFKPEFVGKLNFYISAVDDLLKTPEDKPTIGLLLCRSKSNIKAEYSLRGLTQPLGIAEFESSQVFSNLKSSLPSIDDIENELAKDIEKQ